MRILLVSSTFPPRKFGGITAVSYNLARSLIKRGHDVTVYTTDIIDRRARIPDTKGVKQLDGIKVYYFKNVSNWLASKRFYLPVGLTRMARKELSNFGIIHLHDFRSLLALIVHHYAKKHGIPYVLQAHGSVATLFQKGWLKRIFDVLWGHRILKDASKVIALTEAEREQYKSMGVSEDKIEIVPNGIDLSEFDSLPQRGEFRRKYGLNDNQRIILYLARINKIKGPDLLAKSFAELSKEVDNVKLVFVGPDGGYLPSLKKLVGELKISDKVLFTGPLYGEKKLEAYVDADVYVLPSVYETFPVSVLEACACGTPVIVTDRCGIADVIDGQVGLVVTYDKNQLQDALQRVLSDDQMRQRFGNGGKSLVREKSNWSKITELMESVYLSCLSSRI